jgi:hypothetical protein
VQRTSRTFQGLTVHEVCVPHPKETWFTKYFVVLLQKNKNPKGLLVFGKKTFRERLL